MDSLNLCELCLMFDDHHQVYVPEWIANPDADLTVVFSSRAEQDLNNIDLSPCNWLRSAQELRWPSMVFKRFSLTLSFEEGW